VVVLGVNGGELHGLDPAEKAKAFRKQHGLTYPIVVDDGDLRELFGVRGYGTEIVLDDQGRVRHQGSGVFSGQLYRVLGALLGE
jgi:hypothetical protein